jgi:hypothetical protein
MIRCWVVGAKLYGRLRIFTSICPHAPESGRFLKFAALSGDLFAWCVTPAKMRVLFRDAQRRGSLRGRYPRYALRPVRLPDRALAPDHGCCSGRSFGSIGAEGYRTSGRKPAPAHVMSSLQIANKYGSLI